MDGAIISALAALGGSAVGAIASFASTWLSQTAQDRSAQVAKSVNRREQIYGDFIEEVSRMYGEALTHPIEEPSKLVRLYALVGKLRLFAPPHIVAQAETVMHRILETKHPPHHDLKDFQPADDIVLHFSELCREDLHRYARRTALDLLRSRHEPTQRGVAASPR